MKKPKERKLGTLKHLFSDDEIDEMTQALLEPMAEEELALWYDAPFIAGHEDTLRTQENESIDLCEKGR